MESQPTSQIEQVERTPEISVSFSVDQEIKRVAGTLQNLEWLRKHYGNSNSRLPVGITETSSLEEIKAAVNSDYEVEKYNEYARTLVKQFNELAKNFKDLQKFSAFTFFPKYSVVLTRYGTGGSYDSSKGEVIINIEFRSGEKGVATVTHEIIHIGIQYLITKYNVPHWAKERLVDLIGITHFPEIAKPQNLKDDMSYVDEAFKKFSPDLEAVIASLQPLQNKPE